MNREWMAAGESPKRGLQIWRERRELLRCYKRDERVRRTVKAWFETRADSHPK